MLRTPTGGGGGGGGSADITGLEHVGVSRHGARPLGVAAGWRRWRWCEPNLVPSRFASIRLVPPVCDGVPCIEAHVEPAAGCFAGHLDPPTSPAVEVETPTLPNPASVPTHPSPASLPPVMSPGEAAPTAYHAPGEGVEVRHNSQLSSLSLIRSHGFWGKQSSSSPSENISHCATGATKEQRRCDLLARYSDENVTNRNARFCTGRQRIVLE